MDYNEESKKRLLKISSKKIQTTMIGTLGIIEEKILNNPKLQKFRDILDTIYEEEIRPKILDNGNNQIRNLEEEFKYYTIHWDRYQYTFKVKQKGE